MITTIACAHGQHSACPNPQHCDCDCHKDPEAVREAARQQRAKARELARRAVQDFLDDPVELIVVQTAILALTQYETTLKEARHGRTPPTGTIPRLPRPEPH